MIRKKMFDFWRVYSVKSKIFSGYFIRLCCLYKMHLCNKLLITGLFTKTKEKCFKFTYFYEQILKCTFC
jgi:hypothetical protein